MPKTKKTSISRRKLKEKINRLPHLTEDVIKISLFTIFLLIFFYLWAFSVGINPFSGGRYAAAQYTCDGTDTNCGIWPSCIDCTATSQVCLNNACVECRDDTNCANFEYCDTTGSKTGTPNSCYDFRPELAGCKYYDYCQNGNIPGTGSSCPALGSPSWADNCYTAETDPDQRSTIDTICRQGSYAAHTWFTCPIG